MDTKTAQRQLVSLITQHLSESIPVTRILTYKPDKNGSVTGRFESLNRVFSFVFDGQDVRYKPSGNMDNALFSEHYLERFDAAPATPRGTRALPKCTSKSYSCKGNVGVRCLPLTQSCKLGNSAIGNERLGKIKALSSSLAGGSALETTQAKIVEQRMALAVENRRKKQQQKAATSAKSALTIAKKEEPKATIEFDGGDIDEFIKNASKKHKINPSAESEKLIRQEYGLSGNASEQDLINKKKSDIIEDAYKGVQTWKDAVSKSEKGIKPKLEDDDEDYTTDDFREMLTASQKQLERLKDNPQKLNETAKDFVEKRKSSIKDAFNRINDNPVAKAAHAAGIPFEAITDALGKKSGGEALKKQIQESFKNKRFKEFFDLKEGSTPSRADLKKAYRKASEKFHPDKGGTNEAQKALNQYYDDLKKKYKFDSKRFRILR